MRTRQTRHVCVLLPNKQLLDCTVRVGARGHEMLESVLEQLDISNLLVFGLAVNRENEYVFIDLEQKLKSYFGKRWNRGSPMRQFVLFLRVQYHIGTGRLISSRKEQQLYFTELRQKVLHSQSLHQEALLFQLAASALQADFGDWEQSDEEEGEFRRKERKHRSYFLPEDYFPSWLIRHRGREYLLQHTPVLHRELRGSSWRQAVLQFIKQAGSLLDGAATFYRMRQEENERRSSILLGVAMRGIQIFQEVKGKQCHVRDLSWTDIDRLTFQGSRFEVHAVASLCLPKSLYFTQSAFHSRHILKHLSDTHRLHISTREAVDCIQQLEDMKASQCYREAYICDIETLRQRLHYYNSMSSTSDDSLAMGTTSFWDDKEGGDRKNLAGSETEVEQCVDEPEEVFVDDPAEVSWLAELLRQASVDGRLGFPPSCWTAVTLEMKQVLKKRVEEEESVD